MRKISLALHLERRFRGPRLACMPRSRRRHHRGSLPPEHVAVQHASGGEAPRFRGSPVASTAASPPRSVASLSPKRATRRRVSGRGNRGGAALRGELAVVAAGALRNAPQRYPFPEARCSAAFFGGGKAPRFGWREPRWWRGCRGTHHRGSLSPKRNKAHRAPRRRVLRGG